MIYINGLYRSGSTVIYNIVRQLIVEGLVKDNVVKHHEHWLGIPIFHSDLNIYSYRDVRNCTASFMRKRGWTEHNFQHPSIRTKTAKEFMCFLVRTDRAVKNRVEKEHLSIYELRYEEDIINIELGIKKILSSLNLLLPKDVVDILIECHNIHAVKKFVDTLTVREDRRTQFHPNHISLDKTDYKNWLSEESWNDPDILSWLEERGYE